MSMSTRRGLTAEEVLTVLIFLTMYLNMRMKAAALMQMISYQQQMNLSSSSEDENVNTASMHWRRSGGGRGAAPPRV